MKIKTEKYEMRQELLIAHFVILSSYFGF